MFMMTDEYSWCAVACGGGMSPAQPMKHVVKPMTTVLEEQTTTHLQQQQPQQQTSVCRRDV